MKTHKKLLKFFILTLIIISMLFSGCGKKKNSELYSGSISRSAVETPASSCDEDTICEVNKTISTPEGSVTSLYLTSDKDRVVVEGILENGSIIIDGQKISTTEESKSDLFLSSINKKVIIDGALENGNIVIDGKTISTRPKSKSNLFLTSDNQRVVVSGSLSATSLVGMETAYACINPDGSLFRSKTPCVQGR